MDIKQVYKNEIENIINIWAKAKIFSTDTFYLSKPKNDKESEIISNNRVLHEIRYSLWVLTVLELCKLFDDNNKQCFNLFKFSRKIAQDKNKQIFKTCKIQKNIKEWDELLNKKNIQYTITKLKDLRDKFYAHSDRTIELSAEELSPKEKEIEELLLIGKKIICDFQAEVFNIDQDFKTPILAGKILDDLTKLKEYKEKYR